MKFASLEAFGIHGLLIKGWRAEFGDDLLEIQQAAVEAGLLQGRSLLVIAPASAGKTLVAEMAIARAAMRRERSIYLAPTRALAEEKFVGFLRRFGSVGVRVVISTRDHPDQDAAVLRGEFDILVAVPEKVRFLAARNRALLAGVAVVVADEIQLLADEERGPSLEMLLAEVRWVRPDVQVVAMTAGAAEKAEIAQWLGAEVVQAQRRPVELRTGVWFGGVFRYREHNSGREDEEELAAGEGSWAEQAVALAQELAGRGEPTIVFVRDKATALRLARRIAASQALAPAGGLVDELKGLPPTAGARALRELAAGGVAIHHSDLTAPERQAVERAFADGELGVVVATSTLAVGVNLPARNVVVDPMQWQPPRGRGAMASLRPLPVSDFLAMAGRAGRLGHRDQFGRAILIAGSELERDVLWERYVDCGEPSVRPALGRMGAEDKAVLVGASLVAAEAGLEAAWAATATGRLDGSGGRLPHEVARAADDLRAAGFFDEERRPTALLRPGAAGMDAATLLWLAKLRDGDHTAWNWLSVMALACASPYAERLVFSVRRDELRRHDYVAELFARAESRGLMSAGLRILGRRDLLGVREAQRAAKMTLAMWMWADGVAPEDLEECFAVPAARLEAIASAVAWLMQTAGDMAEALGWPKAALQRLQDAAAQLRHPAGATRGANGAEPSVVSPATGLAPTGQDGGGRAADSAGDQPAPPKPKRAADQKAAGPADAATRHEASGRADGRASVADTAGGTASAQRARADGRELRPSGAAGPRGGATLVLDQAQPDKAWFMGGCMRLTPAEFRLLWRLARSAGECVAPHRLGNYVFGAGEYVAPHQLYPHVSRLRKKLAEAAGGEIDGRKVLESVPRRGWRLNVSRRDVQLIGAEEEETLAAAASSG